MSEASLGPTCFVQCCQQGDQELRCKAHSERGQLLHGYSERQYCLRYILQRDFVEDGSLSTAARCGVALGSARDPLHEAMHL